MRLLSADAPGGAPLTLPDRELVVDPDHVAYCLGDEVRDTQERLLGHLDRAVVTPDLTTVTHVGVQPNQHWKWPRLVDVSALRPVRPGVHALRRGVRSWPDHFPTADVVPGVAEDELPDHPIVPTSGLQRFLLSLTSPGRGGDTAVLATMRDRLPAGETALHAGTHLVEADRFGWGTVGEVEGVVAAPRDGRVLEVVVRHRHGLRHRTARVPVNLVLRAGCNTVSTRARRRDLEDYDVTGSA